MKKTQSSVTAQGIAFARAFESEKKAEERICYDPLARRLIDPAYYFLGRLFAGYGERKGPGVMGFLAVRCRYIDDYLAECLAVGLEQLVILGAGLDSRAYRLQELKERVKVFEVDHPATQKVKIGKIIKIFGSLPEHVTYVPIDFNREDLRELFSYGYDKRKKTLFICEGVVYYLTAESVNQTFAFVAENSAPGSFIIFDYLYASALITGEKRGEIARMQRTERFTGEGLVFGIEEGTIEKFLRARGFGDIVNTSAEDLHKKYFTGTNQKRIVAPIYAIVHASVGG
ncbi:MAG: SAM-dependent methyltransferase [Anaerolineales bacterium]